MADAINLLAVQGGGTGSRREPGDYDVDDDDEDWGKPVLGQYKELPVTSFVEWDKVGEIKNAIRSLRAGYFRDAALLVDQMLEDDRVMGDIMTRCNGLLSSPLDVQPGGDGDDALKVSRACSFAWSKMFPDATLSDLLRWGLLLGVGVGELVWDTSGDLWLPRLKVWHPQFVYFNWATRSYWIQTERTAQVELPRTDTSIHSDGKWVLFTPYGYNRGWLRALVRGLAMPYLIRQWSYRDWARYNEVHGLPIRKAVVPAKANQAEKRAYFSKVQALGNESVILAPTGDEGNRYDVEIVEATSDSYEGFDKLIERAEKSISVCILGQNSSDRAQGGSLAQAKEKIRDDYARFDSKALSQCLMEQAIHWWNAYNFQKAELAPQVHYDVEPPEDQDKQTKALVQLAQALPALSAAGADARAMLDQLGVPLLPEGSEKTIAAPAPNAEPDGDEGPDKKGPNAAEKD